MEQTDDLKIAMANQKRRVWYEKNRDKMRMYLREYRKRNAERIAVLEREYLERTRARRSELHKIWREKNREKREKYAEEWRAKNPDRYEVYTRRGYLKNIAKNLIRNARRSAKKRGLEFSLTNEWAESKWTGNCELTGLPMLPGERRHHMLSPSIDRIDSSLGYVPGNCRFICIAFNMMKNSGTDEEMFTLMRAAIAFADANKSEA